MPESEIVQLRDRVIVLEQLVTQLGNRVHKLEEEKVEWVERMGWK